MVHITGDGSFHMNLNEICTAVSYRLPVITVIMNNRVLGNVRQWQTMFYGSRYSQTDPHRKTDYVKLADAFGAVGYRVSNIAELREALRKAQQSDGPGAHRLPDRQGRARSADDPGRRHDRRSRGRLRRGKIDQCRSLSFLSPYRITPVFWRAFPAFSAAAVQHRLSDRFRDN